MSDHFSKFSRCLCQIDNYWHHLAAQEMANYDLNSPHVVYLNALYDAGEEGITAARLGQLCGKNKADVSRMVAILEKKNLVKKAATGGNMYRAKLSLTAEGRKAALHVRRRTALAVKLAGSGLTAQERETFFKALELITGNLQQLSQNGLPEESEEGESL